MSWENLTPTLMLGGTQYLKEQDLMQSKKEGESLEQYITELYDLVEFCAYGVLKDGMLRDRLVVGIRDLSLSEKLQTDPMLTLEKAKTLIR